MEQIKPAMGTKNESTNPTMASVLLPGATGCGAGWGAGCEYAGGGCLLRGSVEELVFIGSFIFCLLARLSRFGGTQRLFVEDGAATRTDYSFVVNFFAAIVTKHNDFLSLDAFVKRGVRLYYMTKLRPCQAFLKNYGGYGRKKKDVAPRN